MIEIYGATERSFTTPLINCIPKKATVIKDDKDYFLDVEIPYDRKTPHGVLIDYLPYLEQDNIAYVETAWGYQPFRFNNFIKDGKYGSCRAYHVGLDNRRYVLVSASMSNVDLTGAVVTALSQAGASSDFTYSISASNKLDLHSLELGAMKLRDALKAIANEWGVQLSYNKWQIIMKDYPSTHLNEIIQDGYNLRDMKVEENWDEVGNDILFTGYKGVNQGSKMDMRLGIQNPNLIRQIRYDNIIKLDPSPGTDTSQDVWIIADLNDQGLNYPYRYEMLKVNYQILADINAPADIGDIIPVRHKRLGVDITTNVISLEYDTLTKRYKKVEFGNFKPRLKGLANNINTDIQSLTTRLEKGGL